MSQPSTVAITNLDQDLLWKYRFFLTAEKKALTRFLKCVDWSDTQAKPNTKPAPSTAAALRLGGRQAYLLAQRRVVTVVDRPTGAYACGPTEVWFAHQRSSIANGV